MSPGFELVEAAPLTMTRIEVLQGDITRLDVECVVNAANTQLAGGSGVDGAIHRAAGPALREACRRLGGCPTGEARITPGFDLPARWVIHAVGPVYRDGTRNEAALLAAAHRNALALVVEHDIGSVAFPAISCGAYGYPVDEAARIAVAEVVSFVEHDNEERRIVFCCFDERVRDAYRQALEALNSEADE